MADPTEQKLNRLVSLAHKRPDDMRRQIQAARCARPGGLRYFVELMWPTVEPARPFIPGWHLDAICSHLEAVSSGEIKRLLINISPGTSKPVWVGEPVLLKKWGRMRLGNVKEGDEILTHRGRYRRVLAVHDLGEMECLAVTTESGRKVVAEPSHPFLTPMGWVQGKDLRVGDVLAAVVPAEDAFTDQISIAEARVLGYLVGDGGVTHSPIFTNNDPECLEDFERCAAEVGFITSRRGVPPSLHKAGMRATTLGIRGAKPWLERYGLAGKDSYEKRIPPAVLKSSRGVIANFVGAYWSCDGCIKVRHKRARGDIHLAFCTTVSEGLARDTQHALLRLGISTRVRHCVRDLHSKKQPGGKYHFWQVMTTSHEETVKFLNMPGLLSRKNDPLRVLTPQRFVQGPLVEDKILSIQEAGQHQCRCLTVEEDSSFTVNDIAVHNSLLSNVFWPAWEWTTKPHLRYVSFSYSQNLTIRDNVRFRQLIQSPEFRELWGHVFTRSEDQFSLITVMNSRTGFKVASSVSGTATGLRADRLVCDDPNNASEAESEIIREATNTFFKEVLPSRLANPADGAIVVVQQRVHQSDVSGTILDHDMGFTHLMIPMLNDGNPRTTSIGWSDPREEEGELMWPEMYPAHVIERLQRDLGPVAFAGQYQQIPVPRGGALFELKHWQPWPDPHFEGEKNWISPDGRIIYPPMEYIVAAVDTAFTEKEENDYSACVVMGVFRGATTKMAAPANQHAEADPIEFLRIVHDDRPKVCLMFGWAKRVSLHGPPEERPLGVSDKEWNSLEWRTYRQKSWGLVEWVADTCKRYKVDHLVIETQAQGHGLEQELRRLHSNGDWGVELYNARGGRGARSKVERAWAVQHLFSNGLIYCPTHPDTGLHPHWAESILTEMSLFPRGRHDDLSDSCVIALQHLRDAGILVRGDEHDAEYADTLLPPRKSTPLYDT